MTPTLVIGSTLAIVGMLCWFDLHKKQVAVAVEIAIVKKDVNTNYQAMAARIAVLEAKLEEAMLGKTNAEAALAGKTAKSEAQAGQIERQLEAASPSHEHPKVAVVNIEGETVNVQEKKT